jgi:hypothetical protein
VCWLVAAGWVTYTCWEGRCVPATLFESLLSDLDDVVLAQ